MDISVNYLAVLVAGIVSMGIGALWYSPVLFGNTWIKLMGFTEESMKEAKEKGMGKTYAINFVLELLTAFVLAHFLLLQNATTWSTMCSLVFWAWLGFMFPLLASMTLWEGKPWKLFALNVAHRLVTLLAMGAVLTLI